MAVSTQIANSTLLMSNVSMSPRTQVRTRPTYVRLALWSSLILEARSHGWVPVYTRAQFAGEAVGGLTNSTSPMTHKQNKRMPGTLVSAQKMKKMKKCKK